MENEIKITRKNGLRGEDGYKIISVRMKEETVAQLEELSVRTNRSRNEIINLLLEAAINMVKIDE
ncbi:MAG: ribbon-helix-helix protein, CopG family [Clostridia bacterium]|nr:ribbon-helix-helix protein, CopG family [Clostridia bacterium]